MRTDIDARRTYTQVILYLSDAMHCTGRTKIMFLVNYLTGALSGFGARGARGRES